MITGNVLITGGSGTLGRTILSLAQAEKWDCRFTVYSRSEFLHAQLRARFPRVRCVLGDVRDYKRLEAAIAGHDVVIHAAAMKRIPECEQQPDECWRTNVAGSANVVRACLAQGVQRCLGISTDKACRATTMYGASKLAMEKLFRAAPGDAFRLLRYGNVVASRGSVIPIWRAQAARGDPLTVTNPQMTRFWMSPSYAARLVMAGLDEPPGTILVPKLHALSLREMAAAIAPGAALVETGLRSEEKAHEDLVHVDERSLESDTLFRIGPGKTGQCYNSQTAPRLSAAEFLAMLADAESYE